MYDFLDILNNLGINSIELLIALETVFFLLDSSRGLKLTVQ